MHAEKGGVSHVQIITPDNAVLYLRADVLGVEFRVAQERIPDPFGDVLLPDLGLVAPFTQPSTSSVTRRFDTVTCIRPAGIGVLHLSLRRLIEKPEEL